MPFRDHKKILLRAAALAAAFLMTALPAAAELRVDPSLLASEEYNDNIFLTRHNAATDYITRFVPSVHAVYQTPLWDWDAAYSYDYRYFSRYPIDEHNTHTLLFSNRTRLFDNALILDVKDNYRRVSLLPARDFTQESFFVNQSDSNVFTVNPHTTIKPTPNDTFTAGYLYTSTWYKDPTAVNKSDHSVYLETGHDVTSRMTLTTGYKYAHDLNRLENYTKNDLYAGGSYEYQDGAKAFITIGNSWFNFPNSETTSQPFWNGGIAYKLPLTTFSFVAALDYIDDPRGTVQRQDSYIATVSKGTERTILSATAGFREFRSAKTKHLQNSNYFATGTLTHALTTKTRITGNLTVERVEDNTFNKYTSRYLPVIRFEHQPVESIIFAIDYRYTNVYSPDFTQSNYTNNRLSAEIVKRF